MSFLSGENPRADAKPWAFAERGYREQEQRAQPGTAQGKLLEEGVYVTPRAGARGAHVTRPLSHL